MMGAVVQEGQSVMERKLKLEVNIFNHFWNLGCTEHSGIWEKCTEYLG